MPKKIKVEFRDGLLDGKELELDLCAMFSVPYAPCRALTGLENIEIRINAWGDPQCVWIHAAETYKVYSDGERHIAVWESSEMKKCPGPNDWKLSKNELYY